MGTYFIHLIYALNLHILERFKGEIRKGKIKNDLIKKRNRSERVKMSSVFIYLQSYITCNLKC